MMNIYYWAFKCIWRFSCIYSNNSRFEKILIQLVRFRSWRHSWTGEAAFYQYSWQSIHQVTEKKSTKHFFFFLLESLLYTRGPAAMGKVSTRDLFLGTSCSCWVALVKPQHIDEASAQRRCLKHITSRAKKVGQPGLKTWGTGLAR